MTVPSRLLERARSSLPDVVEDIEELVTCESPSGDLAAVAMSADAVSRVIERRLGVVPDRHVIEDCTHLRWETADAPKRVLLLGHHDTVWPRGTLIEHPFDVRGGVLRGPGCYDMKAGLVIAIHAIAALDAPRGVTLLITGDEELGSPTSRSLIETEARGCAATFVLEASAGAAGALKTSRKGVSLYDVRIAGSASHAGLEPERGVNAAVEAAHQILAVCCLSDSARGTTVTPTRLRAGTTSNTVPGTASFSVDVRTCTKEEQLRVDGAMRDMSPLLPGARLSISGGINRPPLTPAASAGLYERAVALAVGLGLGQPARADVGGGSDGNFTAAVGTPTLDGLGAIGGGAHADHEHVLVDSLPDRIALVAALVADTLSTGQS